MSGGLLGWIGGRSRREIGLLWIVWLLILVYLLGSHFVMDALRDLDQQRVRLRASEVSLEKLERLLERRDEIMEQAAGLVDQYMQSQALEASTLLLRRTDRLKSEEVELISVYPVSVQGAAKRFRAKLQGESEDMARLFYQLGEGAPPIVLSELILSAGLGNEDRLSASALLEVEQQGLPEEWVRVFTEWSESISDGEGSNGTNGSSASAANLSPFPYEHIGRDGVFRAAPRRRRSRLEAAAPTIQSLIGKLSLLGVIWGREPTAIIDDESRQTHYRQVGQFIGELEVIEITRSSVTLRYKEEEGRLQ